MKLLGIPKKENFLGMKGRKTSFHYETLVIFIKWLFKALSEIPCVIDIIIHLIIRLVPLKLYEIDIIIIISILNTKSWVLEGLKEIK